MRSASLEAIASAALACERVALILAGSPDIARRPGPPAVLVGALRFESVSFRISTIREAHRIYVLEAGKVVQVGRFDEPAATTDRFRDLVRRQVG